MDGFQRFAQAAILFTTQDSIYSLTGGVKALGVEPTLPQEITVFLSALGSRYKPK